MNTNIILTKIIFHKNMYTNNYLIFNKKLTFFLIIILLLQTILYQFGSSQEIEVSTYIVDITGEGNFLLIQDAIDNSESGDIIYVRNGIYFENIVIDKSITLIGENNNHTIIDGRGAGNAIKINSKNVIINNFTIQHSGIYFPNAGINCTSNHNTIKNNIVRYNFYGITLFVSSNNIIENNIIKENNNCGIYMTNSSNNIVINNTIKNHTYNGIGIYNNSNNNSVRNNSLIYNDYCAINIRISSSNKIIGNKITNNNIGIHVPKSENLVDKNIFLKNNKDIDEEFTTPGFELIFFILSVIVFIFFRTSRKKG